MTDDGVLEPPPPDLPGLSPAPPALASTREALHRLAEDALSSAQAAVGGDIHFLWPTGGFGTQRNGEDRLLPVEGAQMGFVGVGESRTRPITSLGEAAACVVA